MMRIKTVLLAVALGLSTSAYAQNKKAPEPAPKKSEYCMHAGKEYSEGAFLDGKKCVKERSSLNLADKNDFKMVWESSFYKQNTN